MKHKILSIITILAVALGFSSCSDDNWNPRVEKTGSIKLSSMGVDVNDGSNSRADIDVSNYIVTIKKSGAVASGPYTFGSMPEVVSLPIGDYTVEVASHNVQKAEWEAPYYLGSQNFTIQEGSITEVGTVRCVFSNVMVTIVFTPELYAVMGDDCKVNVWVNDDGHLEFGKDETRSGFFEAVNGSTTMVALFTGTVDGNRRSFQQNYTDVKGGQHYTITYSLKMGDSTPPVAPDPENSGTIEPGNDESTGITISTNMVTTVTDEVNGSVNMGGDDEPIVVPVRPGTEDPEEGGDQPGDDPVATADITFDSVLAFSPVTNKIVDGMSGIVNIHSGDGFKHLNVTISSDSDAFVQSVTEMLGLEFDLVNAGDKTDALQSLGFPVNDDFNGKTDVVFDITEFIPILEAFTGTHQFGIEVVDNNGEKSSKTLIFIAE